ncbi:MAG TPA: hypothetical protein VLD61_09785, partial [Methylomirabilota bacterium]|nr:hypothetical protein [Methylomirabilota bacterium]
MTGERRLVAALYAVTLLGVFALAVSSLTEFDFWWYLKSGELIVQAGAVPASDPFSYTAHGRPWINHMWLTQVLLYGLWTTAGRVALLLVKALVVTAVFAVVLRTMRARGIDPILGCAMALLAAWAGRDFWDVRPQIWTYLLVAVYLWVLREGWERRRAPLLWLPLLMVPWANLHAGFVTGLGLIGLIGVGTALTRFIETGNRSESEPPSPRPQAEARPWVGRGVGHRPKAVEGWREVSKILRRAAGLLAVTTLASLANPFGWRAILFPLEVVNTRAFMIGTHEWFSPNFHDPAYRGFEALLLLLIPAFAWGRARLSVTDV